MVKHIVCTELASRIQVQRHIQLLLLPLVFFLQKVRWRGGYSVHRATVYRDQIEPLGKFKTVPPGKRKPQEWGLRLDFSPPPSPQPSTFRHCRICTTLYNKTGQLGEMVHYA